MKKLNKTRPLFAFSLTPWKIKCEEPNMISSDKHVRWSMIVAIKSNTDNIVRRSVIRKTWGSYEFFIGVQLKVFFVVAKAEDRASELTLRSENEKYGDLLQIGINETYKDVGLKALAGMQWVGNHCSEKWIYSSSDDDVVPNLLKLYRQIDTLMVSGTGVATVESLQRLPIVCGYNYRNDGLVERTSGRNIVPLETYPLDKYPVFCSGGFYSMPVKLSNVIYRVSRHHKYFYNDDVWLTGLIRLALIDSGEFPCHDVSDEYCLVFPKDIQVAAHVPNEASKQRHWQKVKDELDKAEKQLN